MMDPSQNDNGHDDDEFGDFGGFEAADPVEAPPQANDGAQAAPSVWATIFAPAVPGAGNVQPDLLCSQNRFPQHLDNPQTVDVAGSAQASIPPDVEPQHSDGATGGTMSAHEGDLHHDIASAENQFDLDNINLANDILDGSFRSAPANSQSSVNIQSHGLDQMPDISGLDLAAGISNDRSHARQVGSSSDIVNSVVNAGGLQNNAQPLPAHSPEMGHRTQRSHVNELGQRAVASANQEAPLQRMQASANQGVDHRNSASQNGKAVHMHEGAAILERANQEKEQLQKELEDRLSVSARLTEDLARAEALAETAKQDLQQAQSRHAAELDNLRAAGHSSLTMVIEEYKLSMASCVQTQLDTCQRTFTQTMKEETDRLRQLLIQQKEEFDSLQREERTKNEEKLKEAVDQMKAEQHKEFDKTMDEEKCKYQENIQAAIQAERESSEKKLSEVVKEEQGKAGQALQSQKESFEKQLSDDSEKQKSELDKALEAQQTKYQEMLAVALREERTRGEEHVATATQVVRDDMNNYLQQQRQSDRALQRRHLASLDIFLETARQQLAMLMDTNSQTTSSDTDQTGDKSASDNRKDDKDVS